MTSDVLDILDLDEPGPRKNLLDTKALLNRTDKKKNVSVKRPDHIPREVWGLQNTFKNELPPLVPTDERPIYKQPKAVIGAGRVRRWKWVPFINSARSDGLVLSHWRRAEDADTDKDYYFARFNKHVEVPKFTQAEYNSYLQDTKWTFEQTEHLMNLARQFDVRFIHMQDKWDVETFPYRPSIEELKARYYGILTSLDRIRGTSMCQSLRYDVDHERRRKQQLSLLYGRSRDEVEEEERLIAELNRIEARRRDRERKKQDLQKLISQAESVARDSGDTQDDEERGNGGIRRPGSSTNMLHHDQPPSGGFQHRKKLVMGGQHGSTQNLAALTDANSRGQGTTSISAGLAAASTTVENSLAASNSIAFPDLGKNPGVHLRSQRMKLPSTLGQKKIRVIENFLAHFQLDPSPPATAEIVEAYNKLRGNILLLCDLRAAMLQCDFELQAARSRMELFAPDRPLPVGLANVTKSNIEVSRGQSLISQDASNSASTSIPPGVDTSVVQALKVADSKRPVLPIHSLGIAGSLSAASGTLIGSSASESLIKRSASVASTTSSRPYGLGSPLPGSVSPAGSQFSGMSDAESVGMSPSYSFSGTGGGQSSSRNRRKRVAATEQGRVMKKLKTKGHLVE